MKIIFLGAPGAGKGTLAEKVSKQYNIPTISTGNIIREALKNGTEMGIKAKSFIEAGQLVPDDVVIGIIKERLANDDCKSGFILDGFPRTIPQAQALEDMGVSIDKVVDIEVSEELIIYRMSGRRVCSSCGASYHIETLPPKKEGVCDNCGGELIQRADDKPETVKDRLAVYHEQTEPLIGFYEEKGNLVKVYCQNDLAENTKNVFKALED